MGIATASTLTESVDSGASLGLIATETNHHFEDSLSALNLGLDLLVEKPMTSNNSQARNLKANAIKLNRSIYVACVLRFSESLNKFKSLLPKLNKIHTVRIECQSYLPEWQPDRNYQESFRSRKDGGGVLLDLVHEIDYAGWIFGWPSSVQARIINTGRLNIEADESAHLLWESPKNGIVSLTLDYLSIPARRHMTAFGESGTLIWDGIENTVKLHGRSGATISFEQYTSKDQMFLDQDLAFVNTALGIVDAHLTSVYDGAKALAVCDAARISSQNRTETKVDYL